MTITLRVHLTSQGYNAIVQGLADTAAGIAERARELAPVDTGRLRASITAVPTPNGAKIIVDCPYAGNVEFGTSHQPPQPYLRPAFPTH